MAASGPLRRKATLAKGPVPEVLSTICVTARVRPSEVPPSARVKSKMATAAPVVVAVEGSAVGSLTVPAALSVPSVLRV